MLQRSDVLTIKLMNLLCKAAGNMSKSDRKKIVDELLNDGVGLTELLYMTDRELLIEYCKKQSYSLVNQYKDAKITIEKG